MLSKLIFLGYDVGTEAGFCSASASIWQTLGYVLMVFKIVIPILLIVFGMIDLGKAVIASKDDEIKKATNALLKRAIAAVVIFFIPTIVGVLMGIVGKFAQVKDDFDICKACISNPNSSLCSVEEDGE